MEQKNQKQKQRINHYHIICSEFGTLFYARRLPDGTYDMVNAYDVTQECMAGVVKRLDKMCKDGKTLTYKLRTDFTTKGVIEYHREVSLLDIKGEKNG